MLHFMDAAPLDDLAAELSISRATLYRLVRRHGLTIFKRVGDRRTWIDRQAVLPLVALQPKVSASSPGTPAPDATASLELAAVSAPPRTRKQREAWSTDRRPVIAGAIIPHPDHTRHQVLMTERRFATQRVWSWPAGHVHKGEQPVDTVLRELNEELVVDNARVVRHLGDVDTHEDVSRYWGRQYRHGYWMLHYQVAIASPTITLIDHEELLRAEWLSLDQVADAVTSLPAELADAAVKFARAATSQPLGAPIQEHTR
jgi:8-oxo-dGTP pyrophosphatase MutT (NUDIX family)